MLTKLVLDLDAVDLNKLFESIKNNQFEMCFADDCLYLYKEDDNLPAIRIIMKELNINNFFVKQIEGEVDGLLSNLAQNWCQERLARDEEAKFAAEHQDELQQMMKNIEDIKRAVIQQQETTVKEDEVDGRRKEKEGSSTEDTD